MAEPSADQALVAATGDAFKSSRLDQMLRNFAASYKLYWLKSVFDEAVEGNRHVTFEKLAARMIAAAGPEAAKSSAPRSRKKEQIADTPTARPSRPADVFMCRASCPSTPPQAIAAACASAARLACAPNGATTTSVGYRPSWNERE